MFKFDGPLVQVEMGLAALQRYSSKDTRGLWRKLTGGEPPGWGDDLVKGATRLQMELQGEGIILPGALFSPAQELPADCVRITFGVASSDFDASELHPLKVLEHLARKYQPPAELTETWIVDQLSTALAHIPKREFQDAMNKLALVYYWSSIIDYPTVRVVALLNIGGIFLLNSRPDDAYISVHQAQYIVEKKNFHDPYLRFYTYAALANVAYLRGDCKSSGGLYLKAADIVRPLGERYLLISMLYQSIGPLMETGEYQICKRVLEDIVAQVSQGEEDYGNAFWAELFHLRSEVADRSEAELGKEKELLQNRVQELQTKYNKLAKRKDTVNKLVIALIRLGSSSLYYFMGALNSGDKHYEQHIRVEQTERLMITQVSETGSNYVY